MSETIQHLAKFDDDALAAGEKLFAPAWEFLRSVPSLDFLPPDDRPEIAFAGRSNVGKSSLINALLRHKGLARTSNTPGRTQELNYFILQGLSLYLVDMPGYGYARAPRDKVEAWTELVRSYLRGRASLKRVFLLIDARHGIKAEDDKIMALLDEAGVSYSIVLTKADKIKEFELEACVNKVGAALAKHPAAFPFLVATSATKGLGIPELRAAFLEAAQL